MIGMQKLQRVTLVEAEIPAKSVGTAFDVVLAGDSEVVHAEREGRKLFFHVAEGTAATQPRKFVLLSLDAANYVPNNPIKFVTLVHDRGGERSLGYLFEVTGVGDAAADV